MSDWDVVDETDETQTDPERDPAGDDNTPEGSSDADPWQVIDQAPMEGSEPAPAQASGDDGWEVADEQPDHQYSQGEAAAAHFAKGAAPAAGGLAAGMLAGGATTAAATPFLGPLAPVAGIAAGVAAGMGTGSVIGMAEDKFLALMGWDKSLDAMHEQYPRTSDLAEMAPAALLLRPGGKAGARVLGAAIGGGIEGINQLASGQYDPTKIAMAAGLGGAFPNANKAGSKLIASGDQIGERIGGKLYRGAAGRYRGGNKNPDLKEIDESPAAEAPQEDDITVANDEPQTAAGVAVEQSPAPEIPGVGNPEGAPGAVPKASGPNDPARNYLKDQPQNQPGTTESKVIDTEPLKGDIKAALTAEEPESVGSPGGENSVEAQVPSQPEAEVPSQGAAPTSIGNEPSVRPLTPDTETANLAAQQEQHRQSASLAPSVDPLEASQAQRQAAAGIKDRVAGEQKGELFQDLPETESPQTAPEPVSPEDMKRLAEDRKIMAQAGWDKTLTHLDRHPPQAQLPIAREAANMIRQEQAKSAGAKASEAEVRRPDGELRKESRKKVGETGVLASSKADLARKQTAIKHYKDIYNEFGPGSENGKSIDVLDANKFADTRAYTKKVWAEVMKRFGGDPLIKDGKGYLPRQQTEGVTEAVQWLRAVKASAKNQNHKNFVTLHGAGPGLGALDRETGGIEGDVKRKPQLPEAAEETMSATDAGADTARVDLEKWSDPDQMESKVYGEQQQKLRDWVNNLDDVDYRLLTGMHEDLAHNVNTTQDPHELLQNFQDDLTKAQTRTPKGEVSSEVELPPRKVQAPELPQNAEPQTLPGKVLAKDSDAFRQAAEFAAKPAKSKAQQLEDLRAKEAWAKRADVSAKEEPIEDTGDEPPKVAPAKVAPKPNAEVDKWLESLSPEDREMFQSAKPEPKKAFDTLRRFAEDEGGAGAAKFVQGVTRYLQGRQARLAKRAPKSLTVGPQASAAMTSYAKSVSADVQEDMRKATANVIHTMDDIRKLYNNAKPEIKRLGLTERDLRRIDLAGQRDKLDTLPPEHKQFYDTMIRPFRDLATDNYRQTRALNDKYHLELDLPDPDVRGIDVQYAPRHKLGSLPWDRGEQNLFDPFSNRSLAGYSPNLELRNLKALRDVGNDPNASSMTGDRMIVSIDGDKRNGFEVSVLRKGQKPLKLRNLPADFDGELGNSLPLKIKGKTSRWQLDHAATDEIEDATGGTVKYLEDPVSNWAQAADSTAKALEQIKLRVKIMESPGFKNLTTKSRTVAQERGYDPAFTRLKEFGNLYMPENLKWVFDDYAKPGFGGDAIIDRLRNFNMGVSKIININAPLVHVLNEAVQVAVARGYRWVWPPSYYRIGRELPTAVRDVNAQGPVQRRMRNAGANPQLAATLASAMHSDYAAMVGMDMTQNASKWDPVAKLYNMTAPQLFDKVFQASSDVTWRLSDYMATAHFLELEAEGNSAKQAATKLNKFFSTYQVGTTIFGKRGLQQFLMDPATTLFGRYKANIFESFKHMGEGMAKGTAAERAEAFSQMLVLGALGIYGFGMVNKGLEKLTGREGIELRPRGMAALPTAAVGLLTGQKGAASVAGQSVSLAPGIQLPIDALTNKNFQGKDIFPQGNWLEDPMVPVEGVGRVAEHAARSLIPPYSGMSQHYSRDDDTGGFTGALEGLAMEQLGISEKSDRANNYEPKVPRMNAQQAKARRKRPDGVIPSFINRFTQ